MSGFKKTAIASSIGLVQSTDGQKQAASTEVKVETQPKQEDKK